MNHEERNIILEMNELMLENYRELAARIAKGSLSAGFTIPQQSAESAYNAQVQVACLGVLVLERVIPILNAVLEVADNENQPQQSAELQDIITSLQGAVSKAATANGLPACQYYRNATPDEIKRACGDDREAA